MNSAYIFLILVTGIVGYMISVTKSRQIQEKAFKQLNDADRKTVFDSFAPFRKYNLVPAALLLIIYILLVQFVEGIPVMVLNIGFTLGYVAYLVSTILYIRQKLIRLNIEPRVVFSVILGLMVQYFGMIFVIVAIVVYFYLKKMMIGA